MLKSAQDAVRGACKPPATKDAAEMSTYAAKESVLTQLTQSDLRPELLYPDLHGAVPDMSHDAGSGQLQPIERKLIGFSLGIGLLLLVALVVVNHVFPAV
jgi:hypothetical protein